jgi:DNA primase
MKFPPSVLDDIKARLPASAVVGRRVRLAKAGREWKGLSPFNKEKSPSFFVNDQKQAWFDFSSGKNGDIFKFVMETEGLSFPEAVERLAAEAGVILPKVTAEAEQREEVRKGLHEAMELATAYFEATLRGEKGGAARRYMAGRGLDGEIATEFRLGYATAERFALRDHLAAKGVSAEVMSEAGLLVHGDEIAVPYDRFRDRIIFPIADTRGRIVAFGGRAMGTDVAAKYLNSPETPLFHKGGMLFNQHRARKAAHDKGTVIAVEGYVDVIAMHKVGFTHTVAPLGTALTEDQLTLLWRMADEPILCFDGDGAGRRAAYRAIDVALPHVSPGKSLRFALLPEGQDPDDLARSGGAPAMAMVLEAARSLVDLLWAREMEAAPADTPERRAAFERRLKEALGHIKDESVRRYYREDIQERLQKQFASAAPARGFGAGSAASRGWQGARGGQAGRNGQRYGAPRPGGPPEPMVASPGLVRSRLYLEQKGENAREAFILLGLASDAVILARFVDEMAEIAFTGPAALRVGQALVDVAASGEITESGLGERLAQPHIATALARLSEVVRPGDRRRSAQKGDSMALGDAIHQAITLHHRARTLHSELRAAEIALAEDMTDANFTWVKDVKLRLESLDGTGADPDDPTAG